MMRGAFVEALLIGGLRWARRPAQRPAADARAAAESRLAVEARVVWLAAPPQTFSRGATQARRQAPLCEPSTRLLRRWWQPRRVQPNRHKSTPPSCLAPLTAL